MKKAILATKVGMTQIFNEDGVLTPVTVLQAGPCVVTQVKTVENDGYSAVQVVRDMAGATRASKAVPGTIRGDFSVSAQENIVHTSDSLENAEIELKRFFVESDYCDYSSPLDPFKYAPDEY